MEDPPSRVPGRFSIFSGGGMTTHHTFRSWIFIPTPKSLISAFVFLHAPLPAYFPFMKYQTNLREEEIKNRLRHDYFYAYGFLK